MNSIVLREFLNCSSATTDIPKRFSWEELCEAAFEGLEKDPARFGLHFHLENLKSLPDGTCNSVRRITSVAWNNRPPPEQIFAHFVPNPRNPSIHPVSDAFLRSAQKGPVAQRSSLGAMDVYNNPNQGRKESPTRVRRSMRNHQCSTSDPFKMGLDSSRSTRAAQSTVRFQRASHASKNTPRTVGSAGSEDSRFEDNEIENETAQITPTDLGSNQPTASLSSGQGPTKADTLLDEVHSCVGSDGFEKQLKGLYKKDIFIGELKESLFTGNRWEGELNTVVIFHRGSSCWQVELRSTNIWGRALGKKETRTRFDKKFDNVRFLGKFSSINTWSAENKRNKSLIYSYILKNVGLSHMPRGICKIADYWEIRPTSSLNVSVVPDNPGRLVGTCFPLDPKSRINRSYTQPSDAIQLTAAVSVGQSQPSELQHKSHGSNESMCPQYVRKDESCQCKPGLLGSVGGRMEQPASAEIDSTCNYSLQEVRAAFGLRKNEVGAPNKKTPSNWAQRVDSIQAIGVDEEAAEQNMTESATSIKYDDDSLYET